MQSSKTHRADKTLILWTLGVFDMPCDANGASVLPNQVIRPPNEAILLPNHVTDPLVCISIHLCQRQTESFMSYSSLTIFWAPKSVDVRKAARIVLRNWQKKTGLQVPDEPPMYLGTTEARRDLLHHKNNYALLSGGISSRWLIIVWSVQAVKSCRI